MFPGMTVEELMSDRVYEYENTKPIYQAWQKYYSTYFDADWARDRWIRSTLEQRSAKLWWHMNEDWEGYGTVNSSIPIQWLALAKRCLQMDHVPSNLHPWAIGILGRFNLARYQAAYHLPSEEYEAIARDLPEVLKALREYPREKLAPPIDEGNWGYCDQ